MRTNALAIAIGVSILAAGITAAGGSSPVRFEPNHGQVDRRWDFVARAGGQQILAGEDEIRIGEISLRLAGSHEGAVWEAIDALPGYVHYVSGILDVPTSSGIIRRQVYPGVDAVYRATTRRLSLELVVAPGADPSRIALQVSAAHLSPPRIDGVPGTFRSSREGMRIETPRGKVARRIELSLDLPETVVAAEPPLLGRDADGHLYLAGRCGAAPSSSFVTKLAPNGYDVLRTTYLDGFDPGSPLALSAGANGEVVVAGARAGEALLVRLDRDGRRVLQRATFGGPGLDAALAAALAADGSVWIAGRTSRGGGDAFVAKVDPSGRPVFSRDLGGAAEDEARSIALDGAGAVYVAGTTASPELQGTKSHGGKDAFVAKIDPGTASLVFLRTIGGSGDDEGAAIAVSSSGEIVVAGTAGSDAFLARLSGSDGTLLSTSTLEGPLDDRAEGLALDDFDRAWIVGARGTGSGADAFVARLAPGATQAEWDSVLAGDRDDTASGIVLDPSGDARVIGLTRSIVFPADRPESTRDGDVFLATLPSGLSPNGVCPGTTNFVGTNSNAWEDPDNWSGGSLPTASDDVCISGFDVVVGAGSQNAGTLRVETGSLTIGAATLTVAGTSEILGSLNLDGGTLTGTGNITTSGAFTWTAGTLSGGGVTTSSGPVTLSGPGIKTLSAHQWDVSGATTWSGAGNLSLSAGAFINNFGTWDCQSDAAIVSGGGAAPAFGNAWIVRKSAGTGTTHIQVPFTNLGSARVESGTIRASAGGSGTGTYNVFAGTTFEFAGGSFNLSGATLLGAGTVSVTGGTITGAVGVSAATFAMSGGTWSGSGTLTVYGTFEWTGGNMTGFGGTTTCNGPLNISGSATKFLSRRLNNTATATWTGSGSISMSNGAEINNSGTWDGQNAGTMVHSFGTASSFRNSGTLRKSIDPGTAQFQLYVLNGGTVDVQAGLLFVNDYAQTAGTTKLTGGNFQSPLNIRIEGGTLAGTGTVTGQVIALSTGAIAPGLSPGTLTFAGDHIQTTTGPSYLVEIGGLTPGVDYDRSIVTGQAQIGGTLKVTLINGFVPASGDSFTVMTYGSHSGTYTLDPPSVGCIGWEIAYGATALVLTARALPAEIKGLVHTSKTDMAWNPAPPYPKTSYQVLRGDLGTLPVGPAGDFCLTPGGTATPSVTDPSTPAPGGGYWYVVREKVDTCGVGTYGFASDGTERISSSCP